MIPDTRHINVTSSARHPSPAVFEAWMVEQGWPESLRESMRRCFDAERLTSPEDHLDLLLDLAYIFDSYARRTMNALCVFKELVKLMDHVFTHHFDIHQENPEGKTIWSHSFDHRLDDMLMKHQELLHRNTGGWIYLHEWVRASYWDFVRHPSVEDITFLKQHILLLCNQGFDVWGTAHTSSSLGKDIDALLSRADKCAERVSDWYAEYEAKQLNQVQTSMPSNLKSSTSTLKPRL